MSLSYRILQLSVNRMGGISYRMLTIFPNCLRKGNNTSSNRLFFMFKHFYHSYSLEENQYSAAFGNSQMSLQFVDTVPQVAMFTNGFLKW